MKSLIARKIFRGKSKDFWLLDKKTRDTNFSKFLLKVKG